MSAFTTFTAFEPVAGTRKDYRLAQALPWDIGRKGGKTEWIPEGFVFQVSTPEFVDTLLPRLAHHPWLLLPSAIHDWFLKDGYDLAFSSGEFRRACRAKGARTLFAIGAYLSTLIWTAVSRKLQETING